MVIPRLLKSVNGVEVPIVPPKVLSVDAAAINGIRAGLWGVVNGARGTARGSRIDDPSMQMAGKTGTSQVRNISAAERETGVVGDHSIPWNQRDHALFVCFAPFNAPKVAVSIVVEHGGADHQAAPMARDILLYALYGGFAPLTAYPASMRKQIDASRQQLNLRDIQPQPQGRTRA